METRDKLNTLEKYKELITLKEKFIFERLEDIKKIEESERNGVQLYNRPNWEAIEYNYNDILNYKYIVFIAKYSMGEDIKSLREDILTIIPIMEKSWKKEGGYVDIIWMLSIGIMLEVSNTEFGRLVQLIEQDNLNDTLIDFLIHYKIPSWDIKNQTFIFKKPYQAIEEIISLSQIEKSQGLSRLKKYLSKEWYRGHSDTGWYNDHKSKWNIHSGYWSFESGALVKILGLDDSSLKNMQYYPYDMVHWMDEKSL